MKKGIKIALTVVGAAVAVVGAGLVGGTYGSYSNYQNIMTISDIYKKENASSSETISVDTWNKNIGNLTADEKDQYNKNLQQQKDAFYKQYPTYDDYKKAYSSYGMTDQQIQDTYNLQVASFSLNYDYNADQGGVIAGSVLLAIGLVVFIAFLVLLLKKKKV